MTQTNDGRSNKIRVMLVDDSAVIRGFISRTLLKDPSIEIVSSVANGELAVKSISRANPDIIILDIEMPVMDGLTAIPLLLERKPDARILMCSTLSQRGASVSLKALSLGATDCIVKPTSTGEMTGASTFQTELLRVVKALGRARTTNRPDTPRKQAAAPPAVAQRQPPPAAKPPKAYELRNDSGLLRPKPEIIAIGSSTGGPNALYAVIGHFKNLNIPIVVTQHMPKTFTAILAQHIQQNCGVPAKEAEDGEHLEPGTVYIAPGGFHMILKETEAGTKVKLDDGPPVNFCRPAVDPMFETVADIYGKKSLAVMLTGMGQDGLTGARSIVDAGGRIIAQDEKTSVVWGMPGAVAQAGICSAVLPLDDIGPWVKAAM